MLGNTNEVVQGRLIGGCVEALQYIYGTDIWPNLEVWNNSILFLETSEENMEPLIFKRFLRNFAAQGILKKIKGLLFSKPGGNLILANRFHEFDSIIIEIFEEYNIPKIPIVTNMDFGHSDPIWTLPYGCLTEINPLEKTISILESGVI